MAIWRTTPYEWSFPVMIEAPIWLPVELNPVKNVVPDQIPLRERFRRER